jgi:GNAT superfamily N-acetyltransferase
MTMEISQLAMNTQLQRGLEQNEGLCWSALFRDSADANRHFRKTATAWLMAVPTVDILAFNRVVGLGLTHPSSQNEIREIIDFYRKAGSARFFVQLSPYAQSDYLDELLSFNGFVRYNNWVKLYRPADRPIPQRQTEPEITVIGPERAATYGHLMTQCFGWTDDQGEVARILAGSVGAAGYRHYFALNEGEPVAAAALYVNGPFASMAMAATLEKYRGKGAQSALLARRLLDARALGCRHIVSETAEELPDKPVQSYRNMRRFGFEMAYLRPNYLYSF